MSKWPLRRPGEQPVPNPFPPVPGNGVEGPVPPFPPVTKTGERGTASAAPGEPGPVPPSGGVRSVQVDAALAGLDGVVLSVRPWAGRHVVRLVRDEDAGHAVYALEPARAGFRWPGHPPGLFASKEAAREYGRQRRLVVEE